jgi:homoserine O-acetyltransferase
MHDYYSQEQHGEYEIFTIEEIKLARGGSLQQAKLAYQTYGKLNTTGDNAILFPVMFSGTSGSLKHYIGEGLALDPEKYFIVIPNQLGNGLSSSPHNTKAPFSKSNFPKLDISDDVRVQKKLCEYLGIKSLELVTGWSMGAQQTYEWAIRYPEMVKRIAPIAGTAVCTPHDQLYVDVFCDALCSDPHWQDGEYKESKDVQAGLNRLANVFALMGLCTEFYKQEQWKALGFSSQQEFLEGFWQAWFAPMDPNALLCMADKWKHGDSSQDYEKDIEKALSRITAKTTVIAFKEDMFIPVKDCQNEQEKINNSELVIIDSLWGHFTMMGLDEKDFKAINQTLEKLLACDI